MDHEQFVKEYRGGRRLSAGEVLGAFAIGFALGHLLRFLDRESVADPNPLPLSASAPDAHHRMMGACVAGR